VAFVIPLLFLLIAAILSPITKPETSYSEAKS